MHGLLKKGLTLAGKLALEIILTVRQNIFAFLHHQYTKYQTNIPNTCKCITGFLLQNVVNINQLFVMRLGLKCSLHRQLNRFWKRLP